jgi:hypothetical protein
MMGGYHHHGYPQMGGYHHHGYPQMGGYPQMMGGQQPGVPQGMGGFPQSGQKPPTKPTSFGQRKEKK